MNLDFSVIGNEAELSKLVHEKADTGAGCPDHLCQGLLAHLCRDGLWGAILSEICQQQEKAREPLLARIEQLVDQILFDAAVSAEKIRHEQLGKLWLAFKRRQHRVF